MKLSSYFWLLPFFCFITGYLALQHVYRIDQLAAPNLIGKQLPDAVAQLSDDNLNIRLIDQKEDPDLPQGTILSQTPAAGQKVKPHQAIHVVISKQQQKKVCPLLLGKNTTEIQTELADLKIRNKSYPVASNQPINTCVAQFPSVGQVLDDPRVITYISAGDKKPVLMPNFKNKSATQAIEFCKQLPQLIQLEITHADAQPRDHICGEQCIIIDQRPLAGSLENLDNKKPLLLQVQVQESTCTGTE
jgi:beta-lactam-binding protein with PASTA domain